MNSIGLTNEAQLANELLAESFKINTLMIERYKKETGDANVTLENHQEKLGAWIAKKKEESEASLKAAAAMKESGDQTKSSTEKLDENKKSLDAHAKSATSAAASTKDFKVETSLLKDVKITDVLKEMNSALATSAGTIKTLSDQFGGLGSRIDNINGYLLGSKNLTSDQTDLLEDQYEKNSYYQEETFKRQMRDLDSSEKLKQIIIDNTDGIKNLTAQELEHLDQTKKYPEESGKKIAALEKENKGYGDSTKKIQDLESSLKKVAQAAATDMSGGVVDLKASADQAKSALESLASSFKDTGDRAQHLTDAFLNLKPGSSEKEDLIIDQLDRANKMRDEANSKQMELVELTIKQQEIENKILEVKLKQAQNAANSKPSPIVIKTDGLEPALAMVLTNIIEKAQVVATQEGRNQLIGLS
jgi:hypothetical protein